MKGVSWSRCTAAVIAVAIASALAAPSLAAAEISGGVVRLGVLTDISVPAWIRLGQAPSPPHGWPSEVKKPSESKYPYDYYKLVKRIPSEVAFRPASADCSLVGKRP